MKEQLLELLQQNARLTNAELAVMLDTTEAEVADAIRALENDGVIKGYSAIVDDELANKDMVTAIIELRVTPQRDSGYEEIAHTIMQYAALLLFENSYKVYICNLPILPCSIVLVISGGKKSGFSKQNPKGEKTN